MTDEKVPPQNRDDETPASDPSPSGSAPESTPSGAPGTPPPGAGASTGADTGGSGGGSAPPPPSSGGGGAGSTGAGAGAPPPPPSGGGTGAGGGTPPPPHTGPSGPGSENRGLMLVLSYLWVLALIPYLMEQRDPEVKWHARHGLVLLVAEILLNVVLFVLSLIPGVGCIVSIVWLLVPIALIVLHVFLIVKAVNGERYTIPYLSQYADQIP